jgi:hypothetical protein
LGNSDRRRLLFCPFDQRLEDCFVEQPVVRQIPQTVLRGCLRNRKRAESGG